MVDVNLYIRFGKIAQVKDFVKNQKDLFLKGGITVSKYVRLLEIVRKSVEFMYNNDPAETTLAQVANYLYNLSGRRGLTPTVEPNVFLIVVQPSSQSVNEGDDVNFLVQVAGGTTPYSYQWLFNGTPITGETNQMLSLTAVDSGDAGNYSVTITDDEGQILTSNNAVLTVNLNTVTVLASAQVSDPFPTLNGGSDPYSYPYTQNIVNNANISWNLLNADNNKFFIFKEPTSQPVKTVWIANVFDNGTIPDFVIRASLTIGSFRYYITRAELAFDPSQPFRLNVS